MNGLDIPICRTAALLAVLVVTATSPVRAQNSAAAPDDICPARLQWARAADPALADFARVAMLAEKVPLDNSVIRRGLGDGSAAPCVTDTALPPRWAARETETPARWKIEPLDVRGRVESDYPRGVNDGALWRTRGLSTALAPAASFEFGPLSATAAPLFVWQQNRGFVYTPTRRPGFSAYAYPFHAGIDMPQRPGGEEVRFADPGQSVLQIRGYGARAGLSTENLWWGPARRNALVMSNNAGGFPHAFLGTVRPLDVWIGRAEVELVWGELQESDFYDDDPTNDRSHFAGIIASFEPRWTPGLVLGGARGFMQTMPAGGLSVRDFLIDPYVDVRDNPLGVGGDNQLLSVFGRWSLPSAGFEAYFEWGRDDHWGDLEDLIKQPDHSQVYTLGFQKVFTPSETRWIRAWGEWTHLQAALPYRSGRGSVTFYTNGSVRAGYTHNGQVLGAGIATGSDGQILGVDVFESWGRVGGYLQRTRYDDDAYYENFARYYAQNGHDVELTAGVNAMLLAHPLLDVSGELNYSHRWNRGFVGFDGNFSSLSTYRNLGAQVRVTVRPPTLTF